MVPQSIVRQLSRLRWRERWLRLSWRAALWLTLISGALALACLIDWIIDLRQDTPWTLRVMMLIGQVALWVAAGLALLGYPWAQPISDNRLALWVEDKVPALGHRLISAVQLNRPHAPTRGMSPELIVAVTREAETQTGRLDFPRLMDHRRLLWSALIAIPFLFVLLWGVILLVVSPDTLSALLARQFLVDVEIPRSVTVESIKYEGTELVPAPKMYSPTGEEVMLRFRVRGLEAGESARGEVRVNPVGRGSERYPLTFESTAPDGSFVFAAKVPVASADFKYRAWLKDGRTRRDSDVFLESRPVAKVGAWTLLPAYYGVRPRWQSATGLDYLPVQMSQWQVDAAWNSLPVPLGPTLPLVGLIAGQPFALPQKGGEIMGPPNAWGKVAVEVQEGKQLTQAVLELLGPSAAGEADVLIRRQPLTLTENGRHAEGIFDLRQRETAYRIVVQDQHGFANADPPRREIRIVPDQTPQVVFLPEVFGEAGQPIEDTEFEGQPIPLVDDPNISGKKGKMKIGFFCRDDYGLRRKDTAWIVYRVNNGDWKRGKLNEVLATESSGFFDLQTGTFERARDTEVEFHAVPAPNPELLSRLFGGGQFTYYVHTKEFPELRIGDEVEFYLEVFDNDPEPNREPGRSEVRIKQVVSSDEYLAWLTRVDEQRQRIQDLDKKQRGIRIPRPGP